MAGILDDRGEALEVLGGELLELEHVVVEELNTDLLAADSVEHPGEFAGRVLAVCPSQGRSLRY
jgi:hypothetical protein